MSEHQDILDSVVLIRGSDDQHKFGTAFAFRAEHPHIWLITCSHVVRAVGGKEKIWIDDERFEQDTRPVVLSMGDEQQADLAVLRARVKNGSSVPVLNLDSVGMEGRSCQVVGFAELTSKTRKSAPIVGELGCCAILQNEKPGSARVRAWKLLLQSDTIEEGYSGSPVVLAGSRTVCAVACIEEYEGERGYAIAIQELQAIWSALPAEWIGPSGNWPQKDVRALLEEMFVEPSDDNDRLRAICVRALPQNARNRLPDDLTNLGLLEWLIDRPELLSEVVNDLSANNRDPATLARLKQTRAAICDYFGLDEQPALPGSRKTDGSEQTFLLVEIWPPVSGSHRCTVQARLFQSEEFVHGICVYVREGDSDGKEGLRISDADQLKKLVIDLRAIIQKRGVDEKQVVIEFALPLSLQSLCVDQWLDRAGNPLGTYLPVVVRSRERLREPDWRVGWRDHWNALRARFNHEFPEPLWWCKVESRRQIRGQLQAGCCVVLEDVPDPLAEETNNILLSLTYAGAAAVLWSRQREGIEDFRAEIEGLLRAKPLGGLPKWIREIREQLWVAEREKSACYHLSLLWDDPDHGLPPTDDDDDFLLAPT